MQEIRICFMRPCAKELYGIDSNTYYATKQAAGLDLRACFDEDEHILDPDDRLLIPVGIAIQPIGDLSLAGFVYSRSGLGSKNGIVVAQGVGVIDSDYRGEIKVPMFNTSKVPYNIKRGERIAQLIFQPIIRPQFSICEQLDTSERGLGGFGHTGKL